MTRRQRTAIAKPEGETKWNSRCGIDLSPDAIRETHRNEVYLQTVMNLLDAGAKKPPWFTVKGAYPKIQELYAQ